MSEDSDSKPYLFSSLEGQNDAAGCSSMATLHRMGSFAEGAELGLASEGSDSSQDPPASPHNNRKMKHSLHEDVDMKSSGSSGSGTESHGNESHGNESHGNESHGNESSGSSNSRSKDSALIESSGSNKSSNSHSPSPPSSSNAFSLLSASSEQDNPSTSGCSSEESAKAKTQKELIKTLKELKLHLPQEKRNKGSKSTTLNTLKYALRCVRQVEANEEYYQLLMINDSQPSGLDVSSYTIEEIESITSEYTLKNTDIFAVAVSLITGKIVYISDQAASILNCKRSVFKDAKFVEFITPQDVSVFYSFTTPYRLPSWSMCTGAESSPADCMQEKSFFCRISGGKECEGDLQYYPFRMTPYLMKVQDTEHSEDQFCCLLLAERVHSGYEAPRIPTDKRIFTTTHTPSCVFQDVDERAVPLLGYLPQDLIGTPVLLHLHPSDRPAMLGIHRKILQYAGQPFDHAIRFCARNGEYITIDTSWSSFVNPWSRKMSFIIGRHKVRMGPVNEDVFAAPTTAEGKSIDSDIQEITEQIHRLLVQPVHNNSSSGFGSLGSNDHLMSVASSSDSNGNGTRQRQEEEDGKRAKPRSFQEICKGVHMQKNQEQQMKKSPTKVQQKSPVVRPKDSACLATGKESPEKQRATVQEELAFKDQTIYSYQQISCLDSVIRYLESCNVPVTVKRKCLSSSNTTSSNSDEDKQRGVDSSMQVSEATGHLKDQSGLSSLDVSKKPPGSGVVTPSLTPLPLPRKPESVVSITSQCSYSSTIVHVGDKKVVSSTRHISAKQEFSSKLHLQKVIEDVPSAEGTEGQVLAVPPAALSPHNPEREAYRKLGLTKQVLAAHTQKEEQMFLSRFRELRGVHAFKADCSLYLERQKGQATSEAVPAARSCKHVSRGAQETAGTRRGRNKKTKSKRIKPNESSDSTPSGHRMTPRPQLQGLNQTSWSPSDTSQSTFPIAYPAVMPAYPLQMYPGAGGMQPRVEAQMPGFRESQCSQDPCIPMQPIQTPYSASLVTPMVALVLPNYMFPQMGNPPQQPFYPKEGSFPVQPSFQPQPSFTTQAPFPPQSNFAIQTQFTSQNPFTSQPPFQPQPFQFASPKEPTKPSEPELREELLRSPTPQSVGGSGPPSPPLFQSRCSSPLQLNLLQLEETQQRCPERQESTAPSVVHQGNYSSGVERAGSATGQTKTKDVPQDEGSPYDGQHSDEFSSSSDLQDLLPEDSRSGTSSATSGSMRSGSNGCGTSASGGSASRTGSNNSSNYFGSVDSSQKSHKAKGQGSILRSGALDGKEKLKYVLQDPPWLLMANADEDVMMSYQLPSRDIQKVLREDREKLRQMQKCQPRFTEEQKRELAEVHPWIRRAGLPKAIDVKACVSCEEVSETLTEGDPPDLHMGESETSDVTAPLANSSEDPAHSEAHGCPGPVT
ncbi:period circadian protein homolog 2 isoform X1 [Pimephales promelas]|uniref:period circadian protein homolog 2 isoform X1 n=1 Tax=Pimephales promelas TaxID=90988 RepID=UPI0019556F0A|nr:period circadian protein homolog 2 isoform X1 [Pimephales promelas]KAG1969119.1 period circadian protein [Pimephales promelas]